MADKSFVMTVTGDEAFIDGALVLFCEGTQWTATIKGPDGKEIPNPQDREEWTRFKLMSFMRDVCLSVVAKRGDEQKAQAVKATADTLMAGITSTLTVK